MTGLSVRRDSVHASPTVWLLLSDNATRRFGAHTFEAMILEETVTTPATWHRVARDSFALDWAEAGVQHHVDFVNAPDGIRGAGSLGSDVTSADREPAGQRVDCIMIARHPATVGTDAR